MVIPSRLGGVFINDKKWCVYVHINKADGKRYVGVTSRSNPNHRWRNGYGYKENPYFNSAIEKYGWDGFIHMVLCNDLPEKMAKNLEVLLINRWQTQNREYGYNMTSGGDGTPNYHPSEETRKKLSVTRMRENLSEETLRRRSEGLRGRKFSDEHKRKIGEGNSKPIKMYLKSGELVNTFKSAREAEVTTGINHSHISQCCHGKRQTTGGYIWRFA